MRVARVAAVAVCVLAAGCGTAPPSTPLPQVSAAPRTSQVATAAGNRAAARAEAARLLALAQLPPGAVRQGRPARSLPGPPLGASSATSVVDRVEAWRVGSPFAAVKAWVPAHPPHGLPAGGSASGEKDGQQYMFGQDYRGPADRSWQSADLEISVAPAGADASTIRVDAVVVWLDPRPIPAGPGRHPVQVTVAGGCPATDRGVTGVSNPGTGLTQRLLPPGPPTAGLRCRYDGLNGRPWHLVATQRLTAPAARQAARSMAARPLSHPDGGAVSCGSGNDAAEVLALAYPGRPDVDLWIKLDGCGGVSNGHITTGDGP
jgi:hypothetical protein